MMQPLWKIVWLFLKRLNTDLPCEPAILFLSSYPREMKMCPHKPCMQIDTAVLLTAKTRKQSKHLPASEQIKGDRAIQWNIIGNNGML